MEHRIDFPVEDGSAFRGWLSGRFGMKLAKVYDDFTYAIGGTAHAVVVSKRRRRIPIGMLALPPNMTVTFGLGGRDAPARVRALAEGETILSADGDEPIILRDGYRIRFAAGTEVPADIAARLNLP